MRKGPGWTSAGTAEPASIRLVSVVSRDDVAALSTEALAARVDELLGEAAG